MSLFVTGSYIQMRNEGCTNIKNEQQIVLSQDNIVWITRLRDRKGGIEMEGKERENMK